MVDKKKNTKITKRLMATIEKKKLELFLWFLSVVILAVFAWPFITTTIEAGYVGAYYNRLLGGTVLEKTCKEGLNFLWPWDKIVPYDSRAQSKDYSVTALAKGGLNVKVDMSVIWYIKKEEVGLLHSTMGPEYVQKVIDPSVVSTVRSTIGSYEQSQLYDGNPLKLQEEVMVLLNDTLINAPFTVHSILIREVKLPEKMAGAISEKFVAEQNVLAERYRVLEAVERYKRSYVDAEGIRIAQSTVNDGMSEAYLRFIGIQATLELAKSNNAKLVIVGDKDGLPLILNPDTMSQSGAMPEGLSPDEYVPEGQEGARADHFVETYNKILEMLGQMESVSEELTSRFPAASEGIGEYTLPQENKVPTGSKGVD